MSKASPSVQDCRENFIAYDLEVTGTNPNTDVIIYIEATRFENLKPMKFFRTFVNHGRLLSPQTTEITGIRNYDVFKKRHRRLMKHLRHFQNSAVGRGWSAIMHHLI